jgi:hypothetical protein
MTFNTYLSIVLKLFASLFIFVAIMSPETVGEWQARKAVAYDSVWGEYFMDCDCTEPFEEGI